MVDTPYKTVDRDNQPVSLPTAQLIADSLATLQTALLAAVNAPSGVQPLPIGAATDAKLEAMRLLLAGTLAVSATALPLPAGAATQATLASVLTALQGTLAISATTLPLPAGAATQATLSAVLAALGTPLQAGGAVTVTGVSTAAAQATLQTAVDRTTPADDLFAITPSDSVALTTIPKALLVTVAGNVAVRGTGATPVTLAVTAGQLLPIRARYVYATNTTATVVGLV